MNTDSTQICLCEDRVGTVLDWYLQEHYQHTQALKYNGQVGRPF